MFVHVFTSSIGEYVAIDSGGYFVQIVFVHQLPHG